MLQSVANQQLRSFEHIVMDGGSDDGTVELLTRWNRYPLRWTCEPDRGQAHAVNKAVSLARGEVIAWLNADDLYEPWTLSRVSAHFTGNPTLDLIYGFALIIDERGEVVRLARHPRPNFTDIYRFTPFLHQPAVFFRRRVYERFGPLREDLDLTMDYEYWLRIGRGVTARFVPEILARIRHRAGAKMDDPGFKRFYREMWPLFRSHGGRLLSPMLLDRLLERWIEYPAFMASWPLRKLLWRAMGVPWGTPLRLR